ncbi:MAG: ABC transporter ATP-binding protein [Lachnospiraceae bacterium]|nr:ABC transporter ATP-binding protein [Candidatus Equihabitans merdae]
MAFIDIKDIGFAYDGMGEKPILYHLSAAVEKGEFIGVVGPSGCGKTTLLRLLSGLTMPSEGEIRIDGRKLEGPHEDISVVFQEYTLFPWLTVRKNVEFGIRQTHKDLSKSQIRQKANEYIERVELKDAVSKFPHQLSGGMRQRAAIARALAMETDILLMDEPFGALDVRIRHELQTLIEDLRNESEQKKTVIFVTHDISEAVRLSDRIWFMLPGRIEADLPVPVAHPRTNLHAAEANILRGIRCELTDRLNIHAGTDNEEDLYEA